MNFLLIKSGTSDRYGARELKRTIHWRLTQPIAAMVTSGKIRSGDLVRVEVADDRASLRFRVQREARVVRPAA